MRIRIRIFQKYVFNHYVFLPQIIGLQPRLLADRADFRTPGRRNRPRAGPKISAS